MPTALARSVTGNHSMVASTIPLANVVAVATVGGGARIPYVTQRLSEAMRLAVTTTPQAQTQMERLASSVTQRRTSSRER